MESDIPKHRLVHWVTDGKQSLTHFTWKEPWEKILHGGYITLCGQYVETRRSQIHEGNPNHGVCRKCSSMEFHKRMREAKEAKRERWFPELVAKIVKREEKRNGCHSK